MFRPVPGRYREGKQLYVVGSKQVIIIIIIITIIDYHYYHYHCWQVYLDRNVIFVMDGAGVWVPTSLNSLIDSAN